MCYVLVSFFERPFFKKYFQLFWKSDLFWKEKIHVARTNFFEKSDIDAVKPKTYWETAKIDADQNIRVAQNR